MRGTRSGRMRISGSFGLALASSFTGARSDASGSWVCGISEVAGAMSVSGACTGSPVSAVAPAAIAVVGAHSGDTTAPSEIVLELLHAMKDTSSGSTGV